MAFRVPLTGTGTNLLTLHLKVAHKVSFFIGTLKLSWCFFTSGVQLLLQVHEGGGETHEKSFGSLCWFSCPCAWSWWWHSAERLKPWGPPQPPAPKAMGCSCPSCQASQGWRAHEPQGLLCVRSAVPAVRTVRDNPASRTVQGRGTCQRQLASIFLGS